MQMVGSVRLDLARICLVHRLLCELWLIRERIRSEQ